LGCFTCKFGRETRLVHSEIIFHDRRALGLHCFTAVFWGASLLTIVAKISKPARTACMTYGNILLRRTPKGAAANRAHGRRNAPDEHRTVAVALRGGSALSWFLQ
jgi:hypothetical protein